MRRLSLKDYTAHNKVPDMAKIGQLIDIEYPYPVKDSILTMMFAPQLRLTGPELVRQQALALKIEACKDENILLEEAEWNRLTDMLTKVQGFTRGDYELVRRINEAEEVEVEQK